MFGKLILGKVVNFFGLSVCHCCHFELRTKFLIGTGLAKMQALVPVAKHSQPIGTVPLCQCKCHSSATGNLNFLMNHMNTVHTMIFYDIKNLLDHCSWVYECRYKKLWI